MSDKLETLLVFVHRWIGIGLCLFFAMWFFTGIVMMYVPFPSLPDADRLNLLEPLSPESLLVPPEQAIQACDMAEIDGLRVISTAHRPTYVCVGDNGKLRAVYADTLEKADPLSLEQAVKIASSALGQSVKLSGPVQYDQWIVHQKFDAYRPFYVVEVADEADTHLYLSTLTGEFLQRTTAQARFWNYLGAVAHWIYPTVLRKHWALWDQTVWWLSLFGITGVTIGLYLGVLHLLKVRRSGGALLSPFRGWMRWHHLLGLFSGLFVFSWVFSGWLSMDHGRLFSTLGATAEQIRLVQGLPMGDLGGGVSIQNLRKYQGVKEINFYMFGGKEVVVAKSERGYVNTQPLARSEIIRAVDTAWVDASILRHGVILPRDTYTDLREGRLPEGTVRVELDDAQSTWIHINPYSGEITSVMDRSRRVYRWLFNGLHSLDIPGFVERRPLWDVVMLVLLILGLFGSLTGVIVGGRRLTKSLRR